MDIFDERGYRSQGKKHQMRVVVRHNGISEGADIKTNRFGSREAAIAKKNRNKIYE